MKRWTNNLILLCTLLSGLPAVGQNADRVVGVSSTETQGAENTRRLIYKVAPVYPPELKRFYSPAADTTAVPTTPQGTVRTVLPLGGNPVLVDGRGDGCRGGEDPGGLP